MATPDKVRGITLIRLAELERFFQYRYGPLLPDDDAGRDDLRVAAHHIAWLGGEVVPHIVAWAHRWCPWLPAEQAAALARRVAADPIKWTADNLAHRIGLTAAERTALGITTIGATDQNKAEREAARKARHRDAQRERRRRDAVRHGRTLQARPVGLPN